MNKVSPLKIVTLFFVLVLSILVFKFNNTLRVPTIFDGKFYTTVNIPTAKHKMALKEKPIALPDLSLWTDSTISAKYQYLELLLDKTNTTSFLVLKNDTIIYKRYLNGVKEGDVTQIFSVTKVFLTALLGIAIKEKIIPNEQVTVDKYMPDLKDENYKKLSLQHLTQMTSGLDYDEYGKILQTIGLYYQKNLTSVIHQAKFIAKPGEKYVYKSIDSQILGECIKNALGKRNVVDFMQTELWEKCGMQDSAYWQIDSKISRSLKYYGGLNMSARDLAKFGVCVMNDGRINGKNVIPYKWLNYCNDTLNRCKKEDKYCRAWYYSVDDNIDDIYYAAGFNGQIMMINETKKVIIIRLGKNKGGIDWYDYMKNLSRLI